MVTVVTFEAHLKMACFISRINYYKTVTNIRCFTSRGAVINNNQILPHREGMELVQNLLDFGILLTESIYDLSGIILINVPRACLDPRSSFTDPFSTNYS
jgi:hypothetical protein